MDRRSFLGLMGSVAPALAVGCGASEGPGGGSRDGRTPSAPTSEPGIDLGPELADRVPRSLMTTDDVEHDLALSLLAGELPTDWTGHGFLVHAVPRGDVPVFVGDGKLLRLDFGGDGVQLTARMLRTPDHHADVATLGHPDGFESQGFARISNTLGFRNFPNTAVVAIGERVFVTSDGGRPWEIDPVTLELVTAVGWNDEWRSVFPGWMDLFVDWPFPLHMTTAHPGIDPESGELFTVNYGLEIIGEQNFTDLLRWDGEGAVDRWELVDQATGRPVEILQSVHQMAVTRNHVIVLDAAFLVELDLSGEAPAEAQLPDAAFYVVRRSDLDPTQPSVGCRRVVLPREAVHFHADFDDSEGIVLHVAHNAGADPSEMLKVGDVGPGGETVPAALAGLPAAPTDLGALGRYVLDPVTAAVVDQVVQYDDRLWGGPALVALEGPALPERYQTLFWASTGLAAELRLDRIEQLYADHPYREVPLDELPDGAPATLVRVDADTARIVDHYVFPVGRAALSPTYVPRAGSTGPTDGYLVLAVISDDDQTPGSSGDEFWVFDAGDLQAGPVARLGHDALRLPFTLHTLWVPTVAPHTASYAVDVRADHEEAVAKLSPELQDLFEAAVYPHFEG